MGVAVGASVAVLAASLILTFGVVRPIVAPIGRNTSRIQAESSRGRFNQQVFGFFQKVNDLLPLDRRKPLEKFVHGVTCFKIVEQGLHGRARGGTLGFHP